MRLRRAISFSRSAVLSSVMGIYFTVKIRKGTKYLLPKTKIGQQAIIFSPADQLSVVQELFATSGKQTIEQTEALSRARENKNEVSLQGQPVPMPHIKLETIINAPIERCFDLARSIDLHKISTGNTQEEAIAGTTSGLIGLNETVTWRARHFGVRQTLTSKITEFERPHFFVDEMLEGAFKSIYHKHIFRPHPRPLSKGEGSRVLPL